MFALNENYMRNIFWLEKRMELGSDLGVVGAGDRGSGGGGWAGWADGRVGRTGDGFGSGGVGKWWGGWGLTCIQEIWDNSCSLYEKRL
jgi:hypothetical protein